MFQTSTQKCQGSGNTVKIKTTDSYMMIQILFPVIESRNSHRVFVFVDR